MCKIVSYAQNGEDIVLWRALGSQPSGWYVDVGAASPIQHSVTKLFYDRGWCGINLEPIEELYDRLAGERPRDVNLCTTVGTGRGETTLYVFTGLPGLTTTDLDVATRHQRTGLEMDIRQVSKRTLGSVLKPYCSCALTFSRSMSTVWRPMCCGRLTWRSAMASIASTPRKLSCSSRSPIRPIHNVSTSRSRRSVPRIHRPLR